MPKPSTLEQEAHQRSLKDFLQLYNTITEFCFNRCISNFNERNASQNETFCVDTCTDNYVQYNQRFMFNFVEHQERRKREQEAEYIEAAKKLEARQLQETVSQQGDASNTSPEQMQQAAQLLENLSSTSGKPGDQMNVQTPVVQVPPQTSSSNSTAVTSVTAPTQQETSS